MLTHTCGGDMSTHTSLYISLSICPSLSLSMDVKADGALSVCSGRHEGQRNDLAMILSPLRRTGKQVEKQLLSIYLSSLQYLSIYMILSASYLSRPTPCRTEIFLICTISLTPSPISYANRNAVLRLHTHNWTDRGRIECR